MDPKWRDELEAAFADGRRPADQALFGGSILAQPGASTPARWPPDWRELPVREVQASEWNSLSADGFRFYLPALLSAAETDTLAGIHAETHLTDGLTDFHARLELTWQGVRGSWLDMRRRFLDGFTPAQGSVVVGFLLSRRDHPVIADEQRRRIEEALQNHWLAAAGLEPEAFWARHGRLPAPAPFDPAALDDLPEPPPPEALRARVLATFTAAYPGDEGIRGGDLGCEPFEVEALYRGRDDWRVLKPEFLDQAGLGFLTPEAFRFYLPAFLLADLDGALRTQTPAFHLTHGLDNLGRVNRLNPREEDGRTWFDYAADRFSVFTPAEAGLIVDYLRWAVDPDDPGASLQEAIANYWLPRARGD